MTMALRRPWRARRERPRHVHLRRDRRPVARPSAIARLAHPLFPLRIVLVIRRPGDPGYAMPRISHQTMPAAQHAVPAPAG